MDNKLKQDALSPLNERREFLRKAGNVSLGVSATALLVNVGHKRARAQEKLSGGGSSDIPTIEQSFFGSHSSGRTRRVTGSTRTIHDMK